MLHVIQKVGCGIAYINDSITIAVGVRLIGTEDELCIGSHTTQRIARKAVDTLDGRACGDVGVVRAVRFDAILYLPSFSVRFRLFTLIITFSDVKLRIIFDVRKFKNAFFNHNHSERKTKARCSLAYMLYNSCYSVTD